MVKTIAHLADIHIRKLHRFVEYRQVFKTLYKQLKQLKQSSEGESYPMILEIKRKYKKEIAELEQKVALLKEFEIKFKSHKCSKCPECPECPKCPKPITTDIDKATKDRYKKLFTKYTNHEQEMDILKQSKKQKKLLKKQLLQQEQAQARLLQQEQTQTQQEHQWLDSQQQSKGVPKPYPYPGFWN